jgi:hypothetical protein
VITSIRSAETNRSTTAAGYVIISMATMLAIDSPAVLVLVVVIQIER